MVSPNTNTMGDWKGANHHPDLGKSALIGITSLQASINSTDQRQRGKIRNTRKCGPYF